MAAIGKHARLGVEGDRNCGICSCGELDVFYNILSDSVCISVLIGMADL